MRTGHLHLYSSIQNQIRSVCSASKVSSSKDVVIVGGGIVGCAVAFNLASRGAKVTVFERDPTYKTASTPLSAGGIRSQFSNKVNVQISLYSAKFVKEIEKHLSVNGESPEVNFVENGYLFMSSTAEGRNILEENLAVQKSCGAHVTLLEPSQVSKKFSFLNTHDITGGSFGERNEGWVDPHSLLIAFRNKAKSLGVEFKHANVNGIKLDSSRTLIEGVSFGENHDFLSCGTFVNAAGPAAGKIVSLATHQKIGSKQHSVPVVPKKRCVFVIECSDKSFAKNCPLVVDPTGVYFRPESSGAFICGTSPPSHQDPDMIEEYSHNDDTNHNKVREDLFSVDHGMFEEMIWPVLAHRVPAFEGLRVLAAWAGHYDYNTLDQNAIVGWHHVIKNMMLANGFSGHGLQQAPAVGMAVSELILDGGFRTLDLSALSINRILEDSPLLERNIV